MKEKLVAHCQSKLKETIDHLREAIDDIQKSANEYGAPKDRYDSYRTQLLRRRDMLAKQLQQAQNQLIALNKIDETLTPNTVSFGSLVYTDKQNLLVAVGLGKIELDGRIFYAISPMVPIAKALEGKKVGDEVLFNGQKIKIEKIG